VQNATFFAIEKTASMATLFIKQSVGLNPFLTRRDWLLQAGILAALVVGALFLNAYGGLYAGRGALIGGFMGTLLPLIMCLPVRGTIAASGEQAFLSRVAQLGYVANGETVEGRIYNFRGKRWTRWDSNRVVIRPGGEVLKATMPLNLYWQVKRLQA
jgi:hypothetical protein